MNPEYTNENEIPPWIELPVDVTANILKRLGIEEILEIAENVCTTWRRICCDPSTWRGLHIKDAGSCDERVLNLWHRAVHRSQGQLLGLTMQDSCNVDLLNYIVDRSSDLKRLTLKECSGITGKTVVEAVNKLPQLEELDLIELPELEGSDIVKIGNACPGLNSFTFSHHLSGDDYSNTNEYAVAIAQNMPNLRHLRLISNLINNEGLEAILDGCPSLESLDIHGCIYLDLKGALGKRCCEQIKHVEFPLDLDSLLEDLRVGTLDMFNKFGYPNYDELDFSDDDI